METSTNPTARIPRRIRHLLSIVLASAFLVVAAAACQPAGCSVNCITGVSVNAPGNQVTVKTTVNTFVTVELFTDSGLAHKVVQKSDGGISTVHPTTITQLSPSTKYWWRVTAIDANNQTKTNLGWFQTANRQVTVKLTRIHLIDDSDSLGDGEMTFHMKVNDTEFHDVYTNDDMSSGTDLKTLNIPATVNNSGTTVSVKVEGQDDDCDGLGGLCTQGLGPTWTHGSTSERDWATASFGPTTLPSVNGSGTWSAKTASYEVQFEVSGTYTVTYLPS